MKYDLEERLIKFSSLVIELAESLPDKRSAQHLCDQLIRSGTAPSLLYGDAEAAESRADFIHKMKIALKELRETFICIQIIDRLSFSHHGSLKPLLQENSELIAIFVASIKTATGKPSPPPSKS